MLALIFVTFAALTVSAGAFPAPAATIVRCRVPCAASPVRKVVRAEGPWRRSQLPANILYSLRARRRFASYLRLRLLEMREAGLERAAAVVERRLPVEALVPPLRAP